MLVLAESHVAALETAARRADRGEACGVILGRRRGAHLEASAVVALRNASSAPDRSYELDPCEVAAQRRMAARAETTILAYYHTHPDDSAAPSPVDRVWWRRISDIADVDRILIIARTSGRMRCFRLHERNLVPELLVTVRRRGGRQSVVAGPART